MVNPAQLVNQVKILLFHEAKFNKVRKQCKNLNIWSSARYCFKDLVSSPDDSESRPKGFSTMTLVQPLFEEAFRLAHFTTSTNMFGGTDR